MAGVKQHILPKFLLKGFSSRIQKKTGKQDVVYTWVHRKDMEPFETITSNVGFEKHFYDEGDLDVDNSITQLEPEFALLLVELRGKDDFHQVTNSRIADFVGHLSIRSKHLRDSLIDVTEVFSSMMFELLSDYKQFRLISLEYHKRHPEVARDAIDKELERRRLPRFQRLRLREAMLLKLRPERIVASMDNSQPEYQLLFGALGPMMVEQIPLLTKKEHIKALAKSLVPEPLSEEYRRLHWFIRKASRPLVLGDVGCLFEIGNPTRHTSLPSKADELRIAYLPISSDTLILGTPTSTPPQVDFNVINEMFVRHSREFFICQESSADQRALQPLLGTKSKLLSDDELRQILIEGFETA